MGIGFKLYLLFTTSWFLHLTSRFPVFGVIRLDMLLIVIIITLILYIPKNRINAASTSKTGKIIFIMFFYSIITVPFVEWPGSVLRHGIETFVKAIVFFYFTVCLVNTERKLKIFMTVFLGCQVLRVIEPVYLHVATGYWGSVASMANWESIDRLAGAPHDTINPNGLAFVIVSVLPFMYYLGFYSKAIAIASIALAPVMLYALLLTSSRTGMVGLMTIAFSIVLKSKRKILLGLVIVVIGAAAFVRLDADQKDRYLSIFYSDTKNAATAGGRRQGIIEDFHVALNRPFFGHGIGTSREANANIGMRDQPSHNLYTEVAQELGFIGLGLFLWFIKSVIMNSSLSSRYLRLNADEKNFTFMVNRALQIWLFMNLVFSVASYGLTSYEWYLFGGLSVVVYRLSNNLSAGTTPIGRESLDEVQPYR